MVQYSKRVPILLLNPFFFLKLKRNLHWCRLISIEFRTDEGQSSIWLSFKFAKGVRQIAPVVNPRYIQRVHNMVLLTY